MPLLEVTGLALLTRLRAEHIGGLALHFYLRQVIKNRFHSYGFLNLRCFFFALAAATSSSSFSLPMAGGDSREPLGGGGKEEEEGGAFFSFAIPLSSCCLSTGGRKRRRKRKPSFTFFFYLSPELACLKRRRGRESSVGRREAFLPSFSVGRSVPWLTAKLPSSSSPPPPSRVTLLPLLPAIKFAKRWDRGALLLPTTVRPRLLPRR